MNVALRPEHLNIISLCTGGGGLDLGVELAMPSARSVCLVEREAYAVGQLVAAMQAGLLAQAPVWSDVQTFDGRGWRGCVDGVVGGIPCQPHSLAGKRLGEDDERDLWSDARRIIVQSGAWFAFIENVRGMLSAKEGLDPGAFRVWRDLQRLGFSVEGGLFTASEVRSSHDRERFFLLAVADARREGSQRGELRRSPRERDGKAAPRPTAKFRSASMGDTHGVGELEPNHEDRSISWQNTRHGAGRAGVGLFPPGPSDVAGWRATLERAPELEPSFRRVADGMASAMDFAHVERLRMLGNGVVPLAAAYAFRTLATRLAAASSAGAAELVLRMAA